MQNATLVSLSAIFVCSCFEGFISIGIEAAVCTNMLSEVVTVSLEILYWQPKHFQ
jgi:hypothetical protein